jgi:hypothetical protein
VLHVHTHRPPPPTFPPLCRSALRAQPAWAVPYMEFLLSGPPAWVVENPKDAGGQANAYENMTIDVRKVAVADGRTLGLTFAEHGVEVADMKTKVTDFYDDDQVSPLSCSGSALSCAELFPACCFPPLAIVTPSRRHTHTHTHTHTARTHAGKSNVPRGGRGSTQARHRLRSGRFLRRHTPDHRSRAPGQTPDAHAGDLGAL